VTATADDSSRWPTKTEHNYYNGEDVRRMGGGRGGRRYQRLVQPEVVVVVIVD